MTVSGESSSGKQVMQSCAMANATKACCSDVFIRFKLFFPKTKAVQSAALHGCNDTATMVSPKNSRAECKRSRLSLAEEHQIPVSNIRKPKTGGHRRVLAVSNRSPPKDTFDVSGTNNTENLCKAEEKENGNATILKYLLERKETFFVLNNDESITLWTMGEPVAPSFRRMNRRSCCATLYSNGSFFLKIFRTTTVPLEIKGWVYITEKCKQRGIQLPDGMAKPLKAGRYLQYKNQTCKTPLRSMLFCQLCTNNAFPNRYLVAVINAET